jgi:hypothetical protein
MILNTRFSYGQQQKSFSLSIEDLFLDLHCVCYPCTCVVHRGGCVTTKNSGIEEEAVKKVHPKAKI